MEWNEAQENVGVNLVDFCALHGIRSIQCDPDAEEQRNFE